MVETLHIVSCKGKWGIYKEKSYRSIRNFKHRDLTFLYAATHFRAKIIVHNTDGEIDFIHYNI